MFGLQGFEPYTPKLVSLERFELSPHGPKPCTLPGYAIESLFLERDGRIELPTLAWKAKVIPFYESRVHSILYQNLLYIACLY